MRKKAAKDRRSPLQVCAQLAVRWVVVGKPRRLACRNVLFQGVALRLQLGSECRGARRREVVVRPEADQHDTTCNGRGARPLDVVEEEANSGDAARDDAHVERLPGKGLFRRFGS